MKAFTANANIAHAATVPSKATVYATLPVELEVIAHGIAGAMQEQVSLSETLGELTRGAADIIGDNVDQIEPFVDACRQMCDAVGLTAGSFKVYLSNIRGVIRAITAGYTPSKGSMTLRAMYDEAPKGLGANKGNAGPRTEGKKAAATSSSGSIGADVAGSDENAVAVPSGPSKADKRRAAMIELFGHADDELDAALSWAAKNELSFVRYVKANLSVGAEPALRKAA